jgi:hypothetical protein
MPDDAAPLSRVTLVAGTSAITAVAALLIAWGRVEEKLDHLTQTDARLERALVDHIEHTGSRFDRVETQLDNIKREQWELHRDGEVFHKKSQKYQDERTP